MCPVHGDDITTEKIENLEYNEVFGLGYYDSQQDKFFKIDADLFDIMNNPIEEAKYRGFNIIAARNVKISKDELGDNIEIELLIDEDLSSVYLELDIIPEWKTGDSPNVTFKPLGQNYLNLNINCNGNGELKYYERMQKINNVYTNWVYYVSNEDVSDITFTLTAVDEYTKLPITFEKILSIQREQISNVLYENDLFAIYKENFKVFAVAKNADVFVSLKKLVNNKWVSANRSGKYTKIPKYMTTYNNFIEYPNYKLINVYQQMNGKWTMINEYKNL